MLSERQHSARQHAGTWTWHPAPDVSYGGGKECCAILCLCDHAVGIPVVVDEVQQGQQHALHLPSLIREAEDVRVHLQKLPILSSIKSNK